MRNFWQPTVAAHKTLLLWGFKTAWTKLVRPLKWMLGTTEPTVGTKECYLLPRSLLKSQTTLPRPSEISEKNWSNVESMKQILGAL